MPEHERHGLERTIVGVDHSAHQFYLVERVGEGVVIRRTSTRHRELHEVGTAFASIYAQLEGEELSRLPLLVDLRAVIGRNDDSFEEELAPHRRRLLTSFARAGILVRSTIGAMQLRRLVSSEGIEIEVFSSEADGLRWLRSPDP